MRERNVQWPTVGWKTILGLLFVDFLANRMFYNVWSTNKNWLGTEILQEVEFKK
jgi:hypothetical protein